MDSIAWYIGPHIFGERKVRCYIWGVLALGIYFNMKAVTTLPRGPIMTSESFYANRRLGVNTLSFKIWGAERETEWITYSTRVMEKGSLMAIALFLDMMKRISLDGVQHVVSWSDVGRHFRSIRTLSTLGYLIPKTYRNGVTNFPLTMAFRFGAPKHFKNACDGHYGIQNHRTALVAQDRDIETIGDLIKAWTEQDAMARANGVVLPPETFIDFLPPPRKEVLAQSVLFTAKSLCQPVDSGFSWSFKCADKRRKGSWYGLPPREWQLTALEVRANIIGTCAAGAERTCLPTVRREEEGEPEDGVEDHAVVMGELADEMAGNDGILLNTTTYEDWKISYAQPKPAFEVHHRRSLKLKEKMAPVLCSMIQPRTSAPLEERIDKLRAGALKRKAQLAAVPTRLR
jgi:hypothetical protein